MTKFTENTAFINNITLVTNELTKDRDGDNTFTIQDIKLLTNDIASITILVNGVLIGQAVVTNINDSISCYDFIIVVYTFKLFRISCYFDDIFITSRIIHLNVP